LKQAPPLSFSVTSIKRGKYQAASSPLSHSLVRLFNGDLNISNVVRIME
jgi:hypothetical protein